jgi:hypothetical protein
MECKYIDVNCEQDQSQNMTNSSIRLVSFEVVSLSSRVTEYVTKMNAYLLELQVTMNSVGDTDFYFDIGVLAILQAYSLYHVLRNAVSAVTTTDNADVVARLGNLCPSSVFVNSLFEIGPEFNRPSRTSKKRKHQQHKSKNDSLAVPAGEESDDCLEMFAPTRNVDKGLCGLPPPFLSSRAEKQQLQDVYFEAWGLFGLRDRVMSKLWPT